MGQPCQDIVIPIANDETPEQTSAVEYYEFLVREAINHLTIRNNVRYKLLLAFPYTVSFISVAQKILCATSRLLGLPAQETQ